MHDRSQTVLSSQESEKYSGKRLDVDQLLEQFLTENLTKDPGYEQIEQGLMIRLLQYLCQAYVPQLHTDSKEGKEKEFHYHRNYYSLILKKYRGKSFQQYLIEVRMKYAKQLLEQTTLPVKQIAQ